MTTPQQPADLTAVELQRLRQIVQRLERHEDYSPAGECVCSIERPLLEPKPTPTTTS